MKFAWSVVAPVLGLVVGVLIMAFGFRKKEQNPGSPGFDNIDGILKQDWTRTDNIDFYVGAVEDASPQRMILRVEERKVTENPMGQDVVQLRWRLATLEEAKEVVACWNARKQ
jgi:hypothetical protein